MSSGTTAIADVLVPEVWGPYTQNLTTLKSRLIQSGAVERDAYLDAFLAGPGLTIHAPSFKDLDDDAENVSTDVTGTSTPNKIQTLQEIAVRLSRNNSWAAADLVSSLIKADPMDAISNLVSDYWVRRMQACFVATMKGVFADNAAAPTGTEHVQNDMTLDIRGGAFADGVTNFSAEAFIDTTLTMGDSMTALGIIMVHSIVYGRMQKNNLIDMVPDATQTIMIPTFLGREVVVDDSMPIVSSGIFESWLFGRGAFRVGIGSPRVPVEIDRKPEAGNGGGQEILYNRVEWCFHPKGHSYVGTAPMGGPSNAATTNNLAAATTWQRAWPERKQIAIARLITREF